MKNSSSNFFATCPKGFEPLVAEELKRPEIGAIDIQQGSGGVLFSGSLQTGYAANLWLRCAIRVLHQLADDFIYGQKDLYPFAHSVDWPSILSPKQTFKVDCRLWDSCISNSMYASLLVKDALCDKLRDIKGERPNVELQCPQVPLYLYLHKNRATLYRDMSGESLHKRGYRDVMHRSSLSETMAAGILTISGWDGSKALFDPMCGSATLVIEAALMAMGRAPGIMRKRFAFQNWQDFDQPMWRHMKQQAKEAALDRPPCELLANDVHPGALSLARKDSASAGVDRFIRFSRRDVADLSKQVEGMVVVNPPWGIRLDDAGEEGGALPAEASWHELGGFLKRCCAGGTEVWVLSGNSDLTRHLGLKCSRKWVLSSGKVDCRLLKYVMLPPRGH